jgi:glutathione S-transferase
MLAPIELKEVHPLGKSPVITVEGSDGTSKVIAETAVIVEYLTEHFGKQLIPTRYALGKEDQPTGETEEWSRYRYFMHHAEGSFMPFLVMTLVFGRKHFSPGGKPARLLKHRIEGTNRPLDRPTHNQGDRRPSGKNVLDAKSDSKLRISGEPTCDCS